MKHFIQQDVSSSSPRPSFTPAQAKCLYTFASISAVKKNLPMDVRRNLAVELRDAENPQLVRAFFEFVAVGFSSLLS